MDQSRKGCSCPHCPEQWVTYRESCYFFSQEKKDWNSSQESCWAQGAHLLVISNTSEIAGLLPEDAHQISLIGLQNRTGSGWTWEDGSKLSGQKVLSNTLVQKCAVLLEGAIHASSCEVFAPRICEKSLQ
ncbi:hypothetical protein AV530_012318 [Patagioenas fasciata monilis]|uniref:C-type lectin domain-containing protein n=1 Tax=Patagioenas fasciata monilis TaxID=372326 RepID=A0A1V4JA60_PATFA|nr:hypothetical protein AV530_012318 [Patagioenas fasciata monilis]